MYKFFKSRERTLGIFCAVMMVFFTACSAGANKVGTADEFSFEFSDKYTILTSATEPKPQKMSDEIYSTAIKRLENKDCKFVAVPSDEQSIIVVQLGRDDGYKVYESLKLLTDAELKQIANTIAAGYSNIGYNMQDANISEAVDRKFFHITGVSGGTAPMQALEQYTTIIDDAMLTLVVFGVKENTEITQKQSAELAAILKTLKIGEKQVSSSSSEASGISSSTSLSASSSSMETSAGTSEASSSEVTVSSSSSAA